LAPLPSAHRPLFAVMSVIPEKYLESELTLLRRDSGQAIPYIEKATHSEDFAADLLRVCRP
jgi:hypothetical protein